MSDAGGFLREIVGGSEIAPEEPDLAIHVFLEQYFSIGVFEFAVDGNGSGAGNSGHPAGAFATGLETANRAVENYEVRSIRGSAVPIAIHMFKAALLF